MSVDGTSNECYLCSHFGHYTEFLTTGMVAAGLSSMKYGSHVCDSILTLLDLQQSQAMNQAAQVPYLLPCCTLARHRPQES